MTNGQLGGRLGLRDLRAMFWVATAATLLLLVRAGVDVPGMHHERLLAGSVFVLGMLACGSGARPDGFTGHAGTFLATLRAIGAAALVVGVLAVVLATSLLTDVLVALMAALWLGATIRHALVAQTPVIDAESVRVKELVS